jgi:response regulator of citrate/malate metabolism
MGCTSSSQLKNPKQIHLKKLDEIYNSYIKNQNKDPLVYKGADELTQ